MSETLEQKLKSYNESDAYPFHMPGHKRQWQGADPYSIDITEIHDFDDLSQPTGILKETMDGFRDLYGAKEAFLSVGGSTTGNLTSIFAATRQHDEVIVARNCHKSVYHGIMLRELEPHFLWPKIDRTGIVREIEPAAVEAAFAEFPNSKALVITSPTYEGLVSDIEAIAKIAHAHGAALIVDCAHGAHFGLSEYFPKNPVTLGADYCVMSLHKTLPCLTQTGVIALGDFGFSDPDRFASYLRTFQTSSPSYVLMSSINRCLAFIKDEGQQAFRDYSKRLERFYEKTAGMTHILTSSYPNQDMGKIVILPNLSPILRERFHLELEMEAIHYCLAMTSSADTDEGLDRLAEALLTLDREFEPEMVSYPKKTKREPRIPLLTEITEPVSMAEAMDAKKEVRYLEGAEGKISGAAVSFYPPGTPVLLPGEKITKLHIVQIQNGANAGLNLQIH